MQRFKEPFNSLSHLAGALLSLVGLIVLLTQSWGRTSRMVAFAIYGMSLVVLYSASAIYHGLHTTERGEDWLRRLDHTAIFFLIAGSYTPICLLGLRPTWGWTLFAVVWAIAVVGTMLKLFVDHLPGWLSASIYLAMGWLAVVATGPLLDTFPVSGLMWLLGGGVLYTIGAVIFALERPDPYPQVFGHHEIFHMFVLGGSALHFVFMQQYVL